MIPRASSLVSTLYISRIRWLPGNHCKLPNASLPFPRQDLEAYQERFIDFTESIS